MARNDVQDDSREELVHALGLANMMLEWRTKWP